LVRWKGFIAEHNTWEKEIDLENIRETVVKFKGRMSTEVRSQEKINRVEDRDFRRGKLLVKYTAESI